VIIMDILGIDWKKVGKIAVLAGSGVGALYLSGFVPGKVKYVKTPLYVVGGGLLGFAGYEGYKLYSGIAGGESIPIENIPDDEMQEQIGEEIGQRELFVSLLNVSSGQTLKAGNDKVTVRVENPTSVSGKFSLSLYVSPADADKDIKFITKEVWLEPYSAKDIPFTIHIWKDWNYLFRTECGFKIYAELWNRQWSKGCSFEKPPCVRFGATELINVCFG